MSSEMYDYLFPYGLITITKVGNELGGGNRSHIEVLHGRELKTTS